MESNDTTNTTKALEDTELLEVTGGNTANTIKHCRFSLYSGGPKPRNDLTEDGYLLRMCVVPHNHVSGSSCEGCSCFQTNWCQNSMHKFLPDGLGKCCG